MVGVKKDIGYLRDLVIIKLMECILFLFYEDIVDFNCFLFFKNLKIV